MPEGMSSDSGAGFRGQQSLLLYGLHGDAVVCHSKCGIMHPEDDTPAHLAEELTSTGTIDR
jgi:hypothetical protein